MFLVETPAGILNEKKENMLNHDSHRNWNSGIWEWHSRYKNLPHGTKIPKYITDRVIFDSTNYGINTSLLVLQPSMAMFNELLNDLTDRAILDYIDKNFRWPDMQFLTLKWSGFWHNIDICYANFYGCPDPKVINGKHYIGQKPWQLKNKSIRNIYSRYEDYKYWYHVFIEMIDKNPNIIENEYMQRLNMKISRWID